MSSNNNISQNKNRATQEIEITVDGGEIASVSASNGLLLEENDQKRIIILTRDSQQELQSGHKKNNKRIITFCAVVIIAVGSLGGGILVSSRKVKQIEIYENILQQKEERLKQWEKELLRIELEQSKATKLKSDSVYYNYEKTNEQ